MGPIFDMPDWALLISERLTMLTTITEPIHYALAVAYAVWVVAAIASVFGTPDPVTDERPWGDL